MTSNESPRSQSVSDVLERDIVYLQTDPYILRHDRAQRHPLAKYFLGFYMSEWLKVSKVNAADSDRAAEAAKPTDVAVDAAPIAAMAALSAEAYRQTYPTRIYEITGAGQSRADLLAESRAAILFGSSQAWAISAGLHFNQVHNMPAHEATELVEASLAAIRPSSDGLDALDVVIGVRQRELGFSRQAIGELVVPQLVNPALARV